MKLGDARRTGQRALAALTHRLGWWLSPRPLIARRIDRRLAPGPRRWLFVVGVNNSGTTLLAQVLTAHPAIAWLPTEGQQLTRALPRPDRLGAVRLWTERGALFRAVEDGDLAADALRVQYDWSRYWQDLPGATFLMEKSPPNTLRTRWLARRFAPASFVALVRSPYGVSEGIARRTGASIVRAATHWDKANRALLEDLTSLERALLVRYEDLVADPGATLERITRSLGLAPLPASAWQGPRAVHNASGEPQPLGDFNADSLRRLSPAERDAITAIAGETMARLGYTPPA